MLAKARQKFFNVPSVYEMSWPRLSSLHQLGRLDGVDLAFARHLIETPSSHTEGLAGLLCHLLHSARNGHICLHFDAKQLSPSPEESWLAPLTLQEKESLSFPLCHSSLLCDMVAAAATLPDSWVCHKKLGDRQLESISLKPLCKAGPFIYLQKHWVFETLFLKHWLRLSAQEPYPPLQTSALEAALKGAVEEKILTPSQAAAIHQAGQQSVTVLSGGPGTGKTYTAGYLIRLLIEAGTASSLDIALAAPTGKAAATLQASMVRALPQGMAFQSTTLHSLLKIHRAGGSSLDADLILIDESSMIDLKLMATLFSQVKDGARLILLGDKDQLPPVEVGGLLGDLAEMAPSSTTRLTTCLRTENRSLQVLAGAVNRGDFKACLHAFQSDEPAIRTFSNQDTELLFSLCKRMLPHPQSSDDAELLAAFQHFRLLSPTRKGPLGVDALNAQLLKHYRSVRCAEEWMACPILITKNNHSLKLYNGDVGVLFRHPHKSLSQGDYALFGSPTSPTKVPAVLLPPFEYAFCLSIHKSQGSEFDHITLILPESSERFGRELLYTAITRARKHIDIFYDEKTLENILATYCKRLSGLRLRASQTLRNEFTSVDA